jgi:hypothetical protein
MHEIEARYQQICEEFDVLIDYAKQISAALKGGDAPCDREYYARLIFAKLLSHAVTLRRISPSGLQPIVSGESELWDLSSSGAIARALIETFDALAYVSLHEVSSEERSFRILLWRLHAGERREKMLNLIGSSPSTIAEIKAQVITLRQELSTSVFFKQTKSELQKNIGNGRTPQFHLCEENRCCSSGINHDYYNALIIYLSSYVHTFPFSIQQLMHLKAGDIESLRLMSMPLRFAAGFLAKAISGIQDLFLDSVPNASEQVTISLDQWESVISNGITDIR